MFDDKSGQLARSFRLAFIRELCTDAALALIVTIVIGLIIASLAAAGIITMSLAYILLGLAWLIAAAGTFLIPWTVTPKNRIIFSGILAGMLTAVGWYETAHYEKPPSAQDIALELSKIINPQKPPTLPPATSNSAPAPAPNGILQSTEAKGILRCDISLPPTEDTIGFLNQLEIYKNQMEGLGDALGINISVTTIRDGLRVAFDANTDEGKERIWRATGTTVTKWNFELRRVGQSILVTFTADRPGLSESYLRTLPPQGDKESFERFERAVERMFGFPANTCHVV
jgi:hypothetical protein